MSDALNMFTDSYIKGLKRPEMFNYNPDDSYGANLLHGSEEQNPWANRDKNNAKFGALAVAPGSAPRVVMGGGTDVSGNLGGLSVGNSATNNADASGSFGSLMGLTASPAINEAGSYLAKEGFDKFKELLKGATDPITEAANAPATGAEVGKVATKGSFDPTSMLVSAVSPVTKLVTGSKLAGDATGAAATTGLAAAQGGMNPVSDLAALMSLLKLGFRIF